MADINNRENNRQPSMRELANERMRQMRAEREGGRTEGAERRPQRTGQSSDSARQRQIQPDGTEVRRSEKRSVNPESSVRRSPEGMEVRRPARRTRGVRFHRAPLL